MQVPTSLIGSRVFQIKFDYQTALELLRQEDDGIISVHLGTLTLDFADGARLTVPPVPIRDGSWDLNYCYGWPGGRVHPRGYRMTSKRGRRLRS